MLLGGYFCVLLGNIGYYWVLLGAFGYFWVLLGTFGYFWVIFYKKFLISSQKLFSVCHFDLISTVVIRLVRQNILLLELFFLT